MSRHPWRVITSTCLQSSDDHGVEGKESLLTSSGPSTLPVIERAIFPDQTLTGLVSELWPIRCWSEPFRNVSQVVRSSLPGHVLAVVGITAQVMHMR